MIRVYSTVQANIVVIKSRSYSARHVFDWKIDPTLCIVDRIERHFIAPGIDIRRQTIHMPK